MAIFSTVLTILVALIPETHGPTLLKWRIAKEGRAPPALKFGKVMNVFKVALARPMIFLFTGKQNAKSSTLFLMRPSQNRWSH
jgi:hypothetical protein